MDCADVRERLVALDDYELGASEAAVVLRHLDGCLSCSGRRARLKAATPRASLVVTPDVRRRLHALDGAAIRAARPRPLPHRERRTLTVPVPLAVAWAFAFCLVSAWGVANWWERAGLEERLAVQSEHVDPTGQIPADAYRPAAWSPEDDPDAR